MIDPDVFLNISVDEDEALRLAREDCKALSRLRRALSKPCHYRTVAPPGFRNEFHWTLSGRDFFKRSSAPKVEEPQESKSSHYANDEDFDEYTTGWRFLDVSEDAERQAQAAADNQKLRSIRRRLRTSCQYSEIAPLKNQFHWSQRGRCHFRRRPKASKSLSESTWAEYRISSELRAESLRYIAQQLVLEAMDKEQRWRVREHGDVLLESPCCEAAGDELLLRADAKEASAVARAWRCTRVYSDIKHVPHPVRPHFSAFARNIFTTNQFAKSSESGMVQCLAATDGLDLEATQDVLQVRAEAKAFAAVAHAFSATRKYSAVCPVFKPVRTHFSAFGRNFPHSVTFVTKALVEKGYAVAVPSRGRRKKSVRFASPPASQAELLKELKERELEELLREDSARYANGFVAGKLAEQERRARVETLDRAQEIFGFADIESPCCEAVRDELLLRADAMAAAAVARAWRCTRVYSDIKHVPHPVRPHFSAFARSIFTTNQFAKPKSGMVQCLAADDGLNLEATQDVLQVRADARAFSQVAHAFSATRKYSAVCPVKHMPAPLRTHFAASSRNVFTTTQFAKSSESGMVQCLAADDGLDLEATQDVLQLRADAKAFSQVAHAFSATRKYSTICPVPKPIRTHFSAFGRNMFTTNQFMRGKDEKAKQQQQQQQQQQQGPSKPSSIKTGSIKFDAMDKKTQQTPLGSPESIMGFPEGFEEEQMPELAI